MLTSLTITLLASTVFCSMDPKDFGPNLSKVANQMHTECSIITGATEEEIAKTRNGDFTGGIEIKRYAACSFLHSGVTDHLHHGNKSLLAELEPPKAKGAAKVYGDCIEQAKETGETDIIKLSWMTYQCAYEKDPEKFIFP